MKKQTIALALALTMVGTLAACGTEKNPSNSGANNGSTTGGTTSGSGSAGQVTRRYNTTMNQGRDYFYDGSSYMDDGRYTAGSNGQVYGGKNNDLSRDLTQGARDIVRGTEDVIDDIGQGIGNAARDITGMGNGAYSGTPSWEPDSSARY